jgi:hypothetical protein
LDGGNQPRAFCAPCRNSPPPGSRRKKPQPATVGVGTHTLPPLSLERTSQRWGEQVSWLAAYPYSLHLPKGPALSGLCRFRSAHSCGAAMDSHHLPWSQRVGLQPSQRCGRDHTGRATRGVCTRQRPERGPAPGLRSQRRATTEVTGRRAGHVISMSRPAQSVPGAPKVAWLLLLTTGSDVRRACRAPRGRGPGATALLPGGLDARPSLEKEEGGIPWP